MVVAMRKWVSVLICVAVPALAQVQEPPPPRWDTDTVKQMLRDIEAERNKAVAARTQKDATVPESAAAPAPPAATTADKAAPKNNGPLIGLSLAALTAKLGTASFIRKDGKVQLLQYARQSCVLDVYLYSGVTHYVEGRTSGAIATESCMRKLLAARGISLPAPADRAPSLPLPPPLLTDLPAAASQQR